MATELWLIAAADTTCPLKRPSKACKSPAAAPAGRMQGVGYGLAAALALGWQDRRAIAQHTQRVWQVRQLIGLCVL